MIGCNTLFEVGIHAAVALPNVERIEFADLGWNVLPEHPVRVEDGYMYAPDRPGAGLDPKPELLEELSRCSSSIPKTVNVNGATP